MLPGLLGLLWCLEGSGCQSSWFGVFWLFLFYSGICKYCSEGYSYCIYYLVWEGDEKLPKLWVVGEEEQCSEAVPV